MRKQEFNQNWSFYKEGSTDRQEVTLPHDAMLHEKRDPESPGTHAAAYFPGAPMYMRRSLQCLRNGRGRSLRWNLRESTETAKSMSMR